MAWVASSVPERDREHGDRDVDYLQRADVGRHGDQDAFLRYRAARPMRTAWLTPALVCFLLNKIK
jgi:hypothetical protein